MAIPVYGAYVQGAFASGTGQNSTLSFPNPVQAGSLLVAAVTWGAATGSVTVTDVLNSIAPQQFTSLMGGVSPAPSLWASVPVFAADTTSSKLFYVPCSERGGVDIVTANFSASQTFTLSIAEYYGGGLFLNSATANGTSAGAGNAQVLVPQLSIPPFAALFEWDRANTFQGALAQSQIQQPGILNVFSLRFTALGSTAIAGNTYRQTVGATYAFGDTSPLLNASAAAAQNVGGTFSGVSTWDLIAASFYMPIIQVTS